MEIIGKTKDGQDIKAYDIRGAKGLSFKVMNLGAVILSSSVPVKGTESRDVDLGFENIEDYFTNGPDFGAVVVRHANRIGGAEFTLNGVKYTLAKNDGDNNLHSGTDYMFCRIYETVKESENSITFGIDSPDGDQGFPGAMRIEVTYTVSDNNELIIDYYAKSDKDTVFNPTNHRYSNLKGAGKGTITDHILQINADRMTYADEASIPNGEIRDLTGTPLDFRTAEVIGKRIDDDYDELNYAHGYDHNYILNKDSASERPEYAHHGKKVTFAAALTSPDKDLTMEVYTDMPGIQVYSGNFLTGSEIGKGGIPYKRRDGIALETQYFPNAINVDSFEKPVIKADEPFYSRTVYKFI